MTSSFLLVFLLLAVLVQSATINFNYASLTSPATVQWSSASSWVENTVPGSADDVVIAGCTSCIGSLGPGAIVLVLPGSTAVKSLTFGGRDIVLSLQGDITAQSFTFSGGKISSDTSTRRTITASTSSTFSRDTTSFCQFSSINFVLSTTTTFTANCESTAVTYSNQASSSWTWNMQASAMIYDGSTTPASSNILINNAGQMTFSSSSPTSAVTVYAAIVNSGTLAFSNVEVIIGSNQASEITLPAPTFNNSGTINLQSGGTLTMYLATLNLLQGSQWSGSGNFKAIAYDDNNHAFIHQYVAQTFPASMLLEGALEFIGHGGDFTITGSLDLRPTIFSGTGRIIVKDLTFNDYTYHNILTAKIGRSINVTGTFLSSMGVAINQVDITKNASITIGSAATGVLNGGYFESSDSTGSFINYGSIQQGSNNLRYTTFTIPFHNYGTLQAASDTAVTYLYGGGQISGTISTPTVSAGALELDAVGVLSLGGGVVLNTGASLPGLTVFDTADSDCASVDSTACQVAGRVQFNGQITLPTVLQSQTSYIVLNSNAAIGDLLRRGGNIVSINGRRTLTVARYVDDAGSYGSSTAILDGTSLVITSYINFTHSPNTMKFANGATIVVNSGATFELHQEFLFRDGDSGNITNNGIMSVYGAYRYISKKLINNGQINLVSSASSAPAVIEFTEDSLFSQTSSGTINLNVYSTSQYDQLKYFPKPAACAFNGGLAVVFRTTPTLNTAFPIIEYQKDGACTGTFAVSVQGLGSGQIGVLIYDFARDGYASNYAYLVVCSSSNTTCSSYQRPGQATATTSTSQSTSATTGDSSAGSYIVCSSIVFLLAAIVLCA